MLLIICVLLYLLFFLQFAICICTLILQFSLNYLTSGLACFFSCIVFLLLCFFYCIFTCILQFMWQKCKTNMQIYFNWYNCIDRDIHIHISIYNRYRDIGVIMILPYIYVVCTIYCCSAPVAAAACTRFTFIFIVRIFMICKLFIYLFN